MTYLLSELMDDTHYDTSESKMTSLLATPYHKRYFAGVKVTFLKDVYNSATIGIEITWGDFHKVFWKTPELLEVFPKRNLYTYISETEISNSDYWISILVDYFLIQGNINKYSTSLRDFDDSICGFRKLLTF